MEWAEFPFTVTCLFRLDVPDMIPLGFGFLSILIEAENILLAPKVVANLGSNRL